MRVEIVGKVVDVEVRTFVDANGQARESFDAFLAADNPRYGADRISGPAELAPAVGQDVRYRASVRARNGARGPWLSVWCVEALHKTAVKAA